MIRPSLKLTILALLAALIFIFTGCTDDSPTFAFGTTVDFVFENNSYGKLKKTMLSDLNAMEATFSTQMEGSDIYRINCAGAGEAVSVDARTMELLKLSKDVYERSGGAYNPAIYSLVELWGFSPDTYTGIDSTFKVPDAQAVSSALVHCDYDGVTLDEAVLTVTKSNANTVLDLGAIAKGYAASRMADLAKEKDADVLVDLGGNLCATGNKAYTIGIAHPRRADTAVSYFAKITLKEAAISTSGDYERYYMDGDVRYCHIIGTDGYPADSGVISCSVVGANGALCDALATAVVVLGREEGAALIRHYGLAAVIISNDKTYSLVNAGDLNFTLTDTEYTAYEVA